MSGKRGNQVWLFSSCRHAMKTANTSSKATEEISLALTTKLFTLNAKKVSVRKRVEDIGIVQAGFPWRKHCLRGILTNKVPNNGEWVIKKKPTQERGLGTL